VTAIVGSSMIAYPAAAQVVAAAAMQAPVLRRRRQQAPFFARSTTSHTRPRLTSTLLDTSQYHSPSTNWCRTIR